MSWASNVSRIAVACLAMVALSEARPAAAAPGAFTQEQAAKGKELFVKHCASCHGDSLEGGMGPPLSGPMFTQLWQTMFNVDDLYYVMRTAMPLPRAGSLSQTENLDVLAFILSNNGFAAGTTALTSDSATLASIKATPPAAGDAAPSPEAAGAPPGGGDPAPPPASRKSFITADAGTTPSGKGPSAADLRDAVTSTDWLYHTHDFHGTRHSPLTQITPDNVRHLQAACVYQLGSAEGFVTGPLVYHGTMYVTTQKLTAAIDAATCRERWQYKWQPQDMELNPNNRGVAIQDGYVVRGTSDGYLLALDSADGHLLWARQIAHPAAGETLAMPPLIYQDLVIIGPAGSELNVQGWVGAFKLSDGSPVWRFNTVPKAGEPGFETWVHDVKYPVGGGSIWSPMSLDLERGELYVPVTNAAPDYPVQVRQGVNLYTDSLIALDPRTGKLKWYAQVVPNDSKDRDLTQVSPIIEAQVGGRMRKIVVAGGKDGIIREFDRESHQELHATPLGTRLNDAISVSTQGTRFCPGTLGGIQWNGPSWLPSTNSLYVPVVDSCTTAKADAEPRLVPGQLYMGGTDETDPDPRGLLTSIDVSTGGVRWQYHADKPLVAAVTTTDSGLVFAGELGGDLIALDARNGNVLYRFNTGGAMAAGVVTYAVDGKQYVGAASGRGSMMFGDGKGAPTVVIFTLPAP